MSGPLNPKAVSIDETVFAKKAYDAIQTFFDKRGLSNSSLKKPFPEPGEDRKQSVTSCRRLGLQNSLNNAERKLKSLAAREDNYQLEIALLNDQIMELKSRKSTDTDEFKKLEHEKGQLLAELEAVTRDLENEKQTLEEVSDIAKNLQLKEKIALTELQTVTTALEAQTKACESMSRELESHKGSQTVLESDLQTLRTEISLKTAEIETCQRKLVHFDALETKVSEKDAEISELKTEAEKTSSRMAEQAAEMEALQKSLQTAENANSELKQLKTELEEKLEDGKCNNLQSKETLEKLELELEQNKKELEEKRTELIDLQTKNSDLESEISALKSDHEKCIEEIETSSKLRNVYYSQCSELSEQLLLEKGEKAAIEQRLEQQLETAKNLAEKLESEHLMHTEFKIRTEKEAIDNKARIADFEAERKQLQEEQERAEAAEATEAMDTDEHQHKVHEMETLISQLQLENTGLRTSRDEERKHSRYLQNQIHTMKGNIRVVARFRPLASCKAPRANITLDSHEIRVVESKADYKGAGRPSVHKFAFDRVFDVQTTNQEVCEEVDYLIQSALDGHNVCIFAYGQTGSGKTYTMGSKDGVNTSAMRQVMQAVANSSKSESQYVYTVSVVCVEIYNEKIHDLLNLSPGYCHSRGIQTPIRSSEELALTSTHENPSQASLVGATEIPVSTFEQAEAIMDTAIERRKMAATDANSQSSRSHLVFTIKINRRSKRGGLDSPPVSSFLNLVDLAGSEKMTHSLASSSRVLETKAINVSLSALGNVISALVDGNRRQHVPFRNSKLTHLLQSSLSGAAKVMVLIALSPEASSIEETKSSLRFAEAASKARID